MSTYYHVAYGHVIQSDFYLPEIPQLSGEHHKADLVISKCRQMFVPPEGMSCKFDFTADTATLAWAEVGSFFLPDPQRIIVTPKHGVAEDILRLPLLGPVLALFLHRKGYFVLHASAVALSTFRGIGFLGDKGAGKSTTAAAFLKHDCHLITDDVLAIAARPSPKMLSAFPQLKLNSDSAEALALPHIEAMAPIDIPGFDKRKHLVTNHFSFQEVPPTRLYILEPGGELSIEPANERQAFQILLRFSYLSRFGNAALQGKRAQTFFEQCANLARLGVVSRLRVPRALDRLTDIVNLVFSDIST
jgi:hypothetical protein